MPFLRFNRDKRGYETTALLHASRRQGKGQPRVLYWFRGPTDVRVGRTPLDEDAIRLLEECHPDVGFDWPKILQGRVILETAGPSQAERRRDAPEPGSASRQGRRGRQQPAETAAPPPASQPAFDFLSFVPPPPAAIPGIEDPEDREGETVELPARHLSAAEERFSPEDLARLRGRHAALLSRIDQYAAAGQADELRARAETLNPDTWVTSADVQQALEHYEATYKALRESLGWAHGSRRRPAKAEPLPSSPKGPETDSGRD